MKKLLFAFFVFCAGNSFAQKSNVYEFYASELGGTKTMTVKGEYVGNFKASDYYYEKIDALNHKVKRVELSDGRLSAMNSYEVNETLIGVSNLKVKEEKSGGKTFYTVRVAPNNNKKPILFKYYNASKGAFDPEMQKEFNYLDVPFATKAKAEEFIKDILAAGLR